MFLTGATRRTAPCQVRRSMAERAEEGRTVQPGECGGPTCSSRLGSPSLVSAPMITSGTALPFMNAWISAGSAAGFLCVPEAA